MAKLKLAAPWTTYYRQIQAMFKHDKEIRVVYDENEVVIKLFVDNETKAEALTRLLPETVTFGNVSLKISVIPANANNGEKKQVEFNDSIDLIQAALDGNGAVAQFYPIEYIFSNRMIYVAFQKEVVQFFNDDLSDVRGMCSTLYANIANELFGRLNGVFFCTDSTEAKGFGMPLGEWP